jgi:HSP20 family protein
MKGVLAVTVTFDPFRELDRLTREVLRTSRTNALEWMPLDMYREGDHYVLNVDLPGTDPGSIDVEVEGGMLTIRARRSGRGEDTQWLAQERPTGSFMRQIRLGGDVDADAIHADYDKGVLSLTIPLAQQAQSRKVEVQTGEEAGHRELGKSEPTQDNTVQGEVTGDSAQ